MKLRLDRKSGEGQLEERVHIFVGADAWCVAQNIGGSFWRYQKWA